jgi:hypothetical protein
VHTEEHQNDKDLCLQPPAGGATTGMTLICCMPISATTSATGSGTWTPVQVSAILKRAGQ